MGDLLGMYTYQLKHSIILLNANLNGALEQMVCAHDIGHDKCHRHESKVTAFKEFMLFNMKSIMEYEANVFAAHIFLDNGEVMDLAKQGYDVCGMARATNTDAKIMLIKLQEFSRLGFNLKVTQDPDSRFFRKIKASGIANYDYTD